jgi:hypothetical protein
MEKPGDNCKVVFGGILLEVAHTPELQIEYFYGGLG